jgi:hypothetical protein
VSEPFYPRTILTWLSRRRISVVRDIAGWVRTNRRGAGALHLGLPWLNLELIDLLERRLASRPHDVFEWGSGGSTVFFGERARRVVSVEHDQRWAGLVREELGRRDIRTVTLRHVPPDSDSNRWTGEVGAPLRAAKLNAFESYIRAGQAAPGGLFDLILVDGKARLECLAQAPGMLAPDGLIVLDDTDMPGRLASARLVVPPPSWVERLTVGPGPASGRRLLTTAALFSRRS